MRSRPGLSARLLVVIAAAALSFAASFEWLNPFGLMPGGEGLSYQTRAHLAKELGVRFVRPEDINLDDWNSSPRDVDVYQQAGLKVILTVRNGGDSAPPPTASKPPLRLELYKRKVGEVLDRYKPEVLVVENEEHSLLYYEGTPQEYGDQLRVACEAAHERNIKCATGGLVSAYAVTLAWKAFVENGETDRAEKLLSHALSPDERATIPYREERIRAAVDQGRQLFEQYKKSGVDYLNLHWYIPDALALRETVGFLRKASGREVMINEMGQHGTDPRQVTELLQAAVDLHLPYAVWASVERPIAKALQNDDGTLRENGAAFKSYMTEVFGSEQSK